MSEENKVRLGDRVETLPELGPGEVVYIKRNTVIVRYDSGEQREHPVEEVKSEG